MTSHINNNSAGTQFVLMHQFRPKQRLFTSFVSKCSFCHGAAEITSTSDGNVPNAILKDYLCASQGCNKVRCEDCLIDVFEVPCGVDMHTAGQFQLQVPTPEQLKEKRRVRVQQEKEQYALVRNGLLLRA
ncbi:hypothetical protein BJ508DRAFT_309325 [Ascobolus immersus RN42]|uniref:Uncharacterized protein n=1 Tax=Ascobolus immersus RN42 TaxID=1160509 RepID=A0A3N4HX48_ASCIM|nr:hypothetical protein BJ508DRAFT_309325 [Ascobolus immersus RN42]